MKFNTLLFTLLLLTTIISAQKLKEHTTISERTPLSVDKSNNPYVFLNTGDLQELVREIQVSRKQRIS